jgi:hypothetical protein
MHWEEGFDLFGTLVGWVFFCGELWGGMGDGVGVFLLLLGELAFEGGVFLFWFEGGVLSYAIYSSILVRF